MVIATTIGASSIATKIDGCGFTIGGTVGGSILSTIGTGGRVTICGYALIIWGC